MSDLIQYSVARIANATMNVPRWQIEGKIVDSYTQQTVEHDFTGGNAIVFPTVLGNLTAAQQDQWVSEVVQELIHRRFQV